MQPQKGPAALAGSFCGCLGPGCGALALHAAAWARDHSVGPLAIREGAYGDRRLFPGRSPALLIRRSERCQRIMYPPPETRRPMWKIAARAPLTTRSYRVAMSGSKLGLNGAKVRNVPVMPGAACQFSRQVPVVNDKDRGRPKCRGDRGQASGQPSTVSMSPAM